MLLPFELNLLLVKSDIKCKIAKTHLFIRDINVDQLPPYINLSIKDLDDSIISINQILEQLIVQQNYTKTLYFSKWRQVDISTLLNSLEVAINVFNIRFDDMLNFYRLNGFKNN